MAKTKTIYSGSAFIRADGLLKQIIWSQLLAFASPCRLLIEVFIRKDFGERYFRRPAAVRTAALFALLPLMTPFAPLIPSKASSYVPYIGWYIYLMLFYVMCRRHHEAQKHAPSVFDFEKYSLDSGGSNDTVARLWKQEAVGGRMRKIFRRISGLEVDIRAFECWIEPAPFFVAGLLLALLGQSLGWLLMFSAAVYSASYCSAYNWGDNHVMDTIDQMIVNAAFPQNFLHDEDGSRTRGYRSYMGRKPNDPAKRKAVLDRMMRDADQAPLAE